MDLITFWIKAMDLKSHSSGSLKFSDSACLKFIKKFRIRHGEGVPLRMALENTALIFYTQISDFNALKEFSSILD